MLVGFCLGCVVASWYATNENMVAAGPLYPPSSLFPLNFLVVGDWGRRGRYNQTLVAAQVWNLQKRNSCFSLSLSRLRSSTSLRSTLCKLLPHFRIYLVKGWDHILWALVLRGCLILYWYDWNSSGEKSTQWWLLHFQDHFVSLIAIGLFFCRQSSVATINMICWWGPVSWHLSWFMCRWEELDKISTLTLWFLLETTSINMDWWDLRTRSFQIHSLTFTQLQACRKLGILVYINIPSFSCLGDFCVQHHKNPNNHCKSLKWWSDTLWVTLVRF